MTLVILHELGHFTAARKSGTKVLEFGIGIPPKICKLRTDKKWTEYTLNAIPLGWFCRLKWEDPTDKKDFLAKDSFISAKFWRKILILAGGVLANFFVAWIIFASVFTIGTKPISVLPENAIQWKSQSLLMPTYSFLEDNWFISGEKADIPLIVDVVMPESIADSLGFMTWDTITNINLQQVNARNIWAVLKDNIGKDINISYNRAWTPKVVSTTCPEDNCILWISFSTSWTLAIQDLKYPIHQAIWLWLKEIWVQTQLTFSALWKLWKSLVSFNGSKIKWSLNGLTWPVWVVKFGEKLLESGGRVLYLAFAGMISLALAIFNILPIPALDWGRMLWVFIQKVFRLKAEKYFVIEWYINTIFFILLMILWIYIILKDLAVFRAVKIPFFG